MNLDDAPQDVTTRLRHRIYHSQADLTRGLAEARSALDAAPAGIEEVSPAPSPASPSGSASAPWGAQPSSADKAGGRAGAAGERKVDFGKVAETARRVAEQSRTAPAAAPVDVAKLGFSGFERAFKAE